MSRRPPRWIAVPLGLAAFLGLMTSGAVLLGDEIRRPDDAPPALPPSESARTVCLPEGFRFELIAPKPLIEEPSDVCWDERGRCFVRELHGYNLEAQYDVQAPSRIGTLDLEVRRIEANKSAEAGTYGTLKLLRDTDGDGQFHKAEVWADRLPPCYGIRPSRGGFRFLRFAWKSACAEGVMIELADRGQWPAATVERGRYMAGRNTTGWRAGAADVPPEWTVVTRDLWKDGGDPTLTGIAPTAIGGPALFDRVELLRPIEPPAPGPR